MNGSPLLAEIAAALEPHGILLRGVAAFEAGEGPLLAGGMCARTVVLLGNVGGSIWPHFSSWREGYGGPNPLDTWSKSLILPLSRAWGVTAYFPSDPPYQPFQRWAVRAEPLTPSPLGILLHPRYGLWHGYRGALGFPFELEQTATTESSTTEPADWPTWLAACPVRAVRTDGFDVTACRAYLASDAGRATCMVDGCAVRNRCRIGAQYRYPPEQLRFHMEALF